LVEPLFAGESAGSGGKKQSGLRAQIRDAVQEDRLEPLFNELTGEPTEEQLADGTLVVDERIKNFLERTPDPSNPDSASAQPVWEHPGEEELAAEEAQLEFEAMHMLAQAHRTATLHDQRARRRIDKLAKRDRKQRREVKALRQASGSRPLRRLRRSIGALAGRGGK